MLWLVGSLAYTMINLVAARLIAGHFAWNMAISSRGPDCFEWLLGYLSAFGILLIWPVALLFFSLTRANISVGAEHRAKLVAQRDRIKQLERELGL